MSFVRNFLGQRRRRMLASLMRYIEEEVYQYLPEEKRKSLRNRVLQTVNEYHDSVIDVVATSVDDGAVQNEEVLNRLASLSTRIDAALGRRAS